MGVQSMAAVQHGAMGALGLLLLGLTEQRIDERPPLARSAVTYISLDGNRLFEPRYGRFELAARESTFRRDANRAQGALLKQQLRHRPFWLGHERQQCNLSVTVDWVANLRHESASPR